MRLTANVECTGCHRIIHTGQEAHHTRLGGDDYFLCFPCFRKVERGGRTPKQTIEACLLQNDPEFGGPDDPCDHEDYRDLHLLGRLDEE